MQRPERTMLIGMLELQDRMNRKINPDWLSAGYPFLRAVLVEAGEAMDHYGWKWWKSQPPNLPQLRIELVDVWHFVLSHFLVNAKGDPASAAATIMEGWEDVSTINLDGKTFSLTEANVIERLELLAALSCLRRVSIPLLSALFDDCGVGPVDLYREYVSKNVLNHFRQDHGYKVGTYQKTWDGKEDNEHLSSILQELDAYSETLPDDLYAALKSVYSKLEAQGRLSA